LSRRLSLRSEGTGTFADNGDDDDWLLSLIDAGDAPSYDILPFHAYPETWENTTVEQYLDT
jgi:hypothetical protein